MSRKITLTANDDHALTAWRADPESEAKGGVVVLHAVFGLADHMGDVCDAFARDGYAAIAPALYDRVGAGIVHPYTRDGVAAGQKSYAAPGRDAILADVEAAASALRAIGKVAISGFCTGGTWAWEAAAALDFDASVNFYGSHVPARLDIQPNCPTIMHYGDSDIIVPMADVERIRAANPDVTVHVYPGGQHAFFNPAQPSYHADAASLAFARSIAFLDETFAPGA
jgi:carboxymethylenebutenolidase